jgi:hypothetical protein
LLLRLLRKIFSGIGRQAIGQTFFSDNRQGGLKMKWEKSSYERQDFYWLKRFDDIAMLKPGKNFLFESIDLAIENPLLDVLLA